MGVHSLSVRDITGILTPRVSTMPVYELREGLPNIPPNIHTHNTGGTGVASMIAAANVGADVLDAATGNMSVLTSQPLLGPIASVVCGTKINTRFDSDALGEINIYWEKIRYLYASFKSGQNSGIVRHENSQDSGGTVYQPILPIQEYWF